MDATGTNSTGTGPTGRDAARIVLGGDTDVGRRREHNEDAWTVFGAGPDGAWKVAIVADGMGGHNAGEVASALAIEVIERELGTGNGHGAGGQVGAAGVTTASGTDASIDTSGSGRSAGPSGAAGQSGAGGLSGVGTDGIDAAGTAGIGAARLSADPSKALRAAIERANSAIWEESRRDPSRQGMGTTVVGAIFANGRAYLANVGDSPAFFVRGGQSRQVTRDHGWVAEQVEAGLIAPEDAPTHPYRNILTRCLGTEPTVAVEVYEPLDLAPGDQVVLCSDGVTAHVAVEEIGPVVARATPTAAARLLISLTNERGGIDNITVVVARVVAS